MAFAIDDADATLSFAGYGVGNNYENGFSKTTTVGKMSGFETGSVHKIIITFTATKTAHNVKITSLNGENAYIDSFKLYDRADIISDVEDKIDFAGTAIRIKGVQGLRFKSTVDLSLLSADDTGAKVVEYGTLAIKTSNMKGDITVADLENGVYDYTKSDGTISSRLKKGVAYNVADGTNVLFATTVYDNMFTGVLIGISEKNYDVDYTIRAYAKVRFANGETTYVYGDMQTASVKGVAEYIVSNNLETAEVREYINTNILNK